MLRTVLLGGLVALSCGASAGAFSQQLVQRVVSSDAGSRLEIASVAAPFAPTPWAQGDPTAPQPLPAYFAHATDDSGAIRPEPAPAAAEISPLESAVEPTSEPAELAEGDDAGEVDDLPFDAFADEPTSPAPRENGLIVASYAG